MNVFQKMYFSIFRLREYTRLLQDRMFSTLFYGAFILSLTFGLVMGHGIFNLRSEIGDLSTMIERYVPDFEIIDGKMSMKEEIIYNQRGWYINIDTSEEGAFFELTEKKLHEMTKDYGFMLLIDREKLLLANPIQFRIFYFSDLTKEYFSKEHLIQMVPMIRNQLILAGVLMFFMMLVFYFSVLAFFTLLAKMYSSFIRRMISFKNVYKISIYASTLPCLLILVSNFLPFPIPYFSYFVVYIMFFIMQRAIVGLDRNVKSFEIRSEEDLEKLFQILREESKKNILEKKEDGNIIKNTNIEEKKDTYVRHQPDVIVPSSGWSFKKKE